MRPNRNSARNAAWVGLKIGSRIVFHAQTSRWQQGGFARFAQAMRRLHAGHGMRLACIRAHRRSARPSIGVTRRNKCRRGAARGKGLVDVVRREKRARIGVGQGVSTDAHARKDVAAMALRRPTCDGHGEALRRFAQDSGGGKNRFRSNICASRLVALRPVGAPGSQARSATTRTCFTIHLAPSRSESPRPTGTGGPP
jgi:hypothetical protein